MYEMPCFLKYPMEKVCKTLLYDLEFHFKFKSNAQVKAFNEQIKLKLHCESMYPYKCDENMIFNY